MSSQELVAFYTKRKEEFSKQLAETSSQINVISNVRLAIAFLFLFLLYYGLRHHAGFLIVLPFLVLLFLYLVRTHSKLFDSKTHFQNLVKINEEEEKSIHGDVSSLGTGSEFTDPHHPYSHDLDIFGEGSLYQWLNRANTLIGRKKFADRLAYPLQSSEKIVATQQAVREMSAMTDFRQDFEAAGKEIDEKPQDRAQLLAWLKHPAFLYGKNVYRIILVALPVITLGLLVAAFFDIRFRPFVILMAIFQWAFLGFHIKKVNAFHDYISRKKNILQKYAQLLHYVQNQKFQSQELKSHSEKAQRADQKVKKLASLVYALDARMNVMTSLFTNSFLLYDLQCVYRLEKWKEENAGNLESWLDTVSEIEVLNGFSTFSFNHPSFTFPTIHDQLNISATGLGHPLISPEECVANDFSIGNGPTVLIITGANMAGKSTFLRTIGINLILALNGSSVSAKTFSCPVISLRTGMRTADSLKDHQSYFYAELDRLKGIMDELRRDIPLLILLDEILKGTNSTDKQAGSIALVKQLLPHPCLAVIATHDLALGDLQTEYPAKVKNYCFEANIENDQLSFDYKLKQGLATKMNATFLMKKMGIIPA
jgi:ABC-type multidrug transport system fused ATPase/permease subunit